MTLTDQEIEELRIAIAEEMQVEQHETLWKFKYILGGNTIESTGWTSVESAKEDSLGLRNIGAACFNIERYSRPLDIPPYTTSIDSIREAAMERFKCPADRDAFHTSLKETEEHDDLTHVWQLTALDWAIAFARTAKIWRYKV